MLPFALTIFTGAFLLFQVQPLIGKYILPWFGGSPGVWTTCLLFFQTLLLGGYAYAHFVSTRLKPRQQAILHVVLLLVALALLPIIPSDSWKAHLDGNPVTRILLLLTVCIGLPYFMLSSTGPLMQQWFSLTNPGVSPYRLYALSNVGSLLALLSYPLYFERKFSRHEQATMWSIGLGLFVLFCGFCAWRMSRVQPQIASAPPPTPAAGENAVESATPQVDTSAARTPPLDKLLWVSLPAMASVLLLATTNKLCQEVAVIPFLWVLPLSLYLLSFILCFDHPRWYHRGFFSALLFAGIGAVLYALFYGNKVHMTYQVSIYCITLFAACMVCHGELFQLKPPPQRLTGYFLAIAAGGALGGFLVSVVAPWVFKEYWELQIGFWALTYFIGVLALRQRSRAMVIGAAIGALLSTLLVPALNTARISSSGFTSEAEDLFKSFGSDLAAIYRGQWPWILLVVAGLYAWWAFRFRNAQRARMVAAGALLATVVVAFCSSLTRAYSTLFPELWSFTKEFGVAVSAFYKDHWIWIVVGVAIFGICVLTVPRRQWEMRLGGFVMLLSVMIGMIFMLETQQNAERHVLSSSRNFYGTLKVIDYNADEPKDHYYLLLNGITTHGLQRTSFPEIMWPTSYYAETSGVGLAIGNLTKPVGQRRMGLVGLGTGTLAAYGKKGDYIRIYEINPDVKTLATSRFTYVGLSQAQVDIAMGDARISMEHEAAKGDYQQFDLLALDAFSSDAIPVHLLTKESFEIYMKHMAPGGVIAVHTSNRYLDLVPIVEALARHFELDVAVISDDNREEWWVYNTTWVLLTKNKAVLNAEEIQEAAKKAHTESAPLPMWTDDRASLVEILK